VMNVFLSSFFGMLAFWITTSRNLFSLVYGVGQFLSGYIAPMALFPAEVQNVARLLPFRSYLGLPVETLLGRLTAAEVLEGLGVTLVWTVIFFLLYRWLWFKGLRRYEGVGA
jgi:ABC-2 type transport system permease protein